MQRQQHVRELKGRNGKCGLHTVKPQGIEWRQQFWKYLGMKVVRLVKLDHNLLAYVHRSQCYQYAQPVFPDLTELSHATCPACVLRSQSYHMPSLYSQISQCYLMLHGQLVFPDLTVLSVTWTWTNHFSASNLHMWTCTAYSFYVLN